jgi:hypothetical protein
MNGRWQRFNLQVGMHKASLVSERVSSSLFVLVEFPARTGLNDNEKGNFAQLVVGRMPSPFPFQSLLLIWHILIDIDPSL